MKGRSARKRYIGRSLADCRSGHDDPENFDRLWHRDPALLARSTECVSELQLVAAGVPDGHRRFTPEQAGVPFPTAPLAAHGRLTVGVNDLKTEEALAKLTQRGRPTSGARTVERAIDLVIDGPADGPATVSYTHLTLPTICSV